MPQTTRHNRGCIGVVHDPRYNYMNGFNHYEKTCLACQQLLVDSLYNTIRELDDKLKKHLKEHKCQMLM